MGFILCLLSLGFLYLILLETNTCHLSRYVSYGYSSRGLSRLLKMLRLLSVQNVQVLSQSYILKQNSKPYNFRSCITGLQKHKPPPFYDAFHDVFVGLGPWKVLAKPKNRPSPFYEMSYTVFVIVESLSKAKMSTTVFGFECKI